MCRKSITLLLCFLALLSSCEQVCCYRMNQSGHEHSSILKHMLLVLDMEHFSLPNDGSTLQPAELGDRLLKERRVLRGLCN
jgi:hypothetical protein